MKARSIGCLVFMLTAFVLIGCGGGGAASGNLWNATNAEIRHLVAEIKPHEVSRSAGGRWRAAWSALEPRRGRRAPPAIEPAQQQQERRGDDHHSGDEQEPWLGRVAARADRGGQP